MEISLRSTHSTWRCGGFRSVWMYENTIPPLSTGWNQYGNLHVESCCLSREQRASAEPDSCLMHSYLSAAEGPDKAPGEGGGVGNTQYITVVVISIKSLSWKLRLFLYAQLQGSLAQKLLSSRMPAPQAQSGSPDLQAYRTCRATGF